MSPPSGKMQAWKHKQEARWIPPESFAPTWSARQEGRWEQAIWSVMERSESVTHVKRVGERSAHGREPCWWGYANQKNSL